MLEPVQRFVAAQQTFSISKGIEICLTEAGEWMIKHGGITGKVANTFLFVVKVNLVAATALMEFSTYLMATGITLLASFLTLRQFTILNRVSVFCAKSTVELGWFVIRRPILVAVGFITIVTGAAIGVALIAARCGLIRLPQGGIQLGPFQINPFLRGDFGQLDGLQIDVRNYNNDEKGYQEKLSVLAKNGVKELCADETLCGYLDQEDDDKIEGGAERIKDVDSNVTVPVANYIQWKEILDENISCPEKFESEHLIQYNTRFQKIKRARGLVTKLTDKKSFLKALFTGKEKAALTKGSPEWELVDLVVELAGNLHQGKLMSKAVVGINGMAYELLFSKAWQDALTELNNNEEQQTN